MCGPVCVCVCAVCLIDQSACGCCVMRTHMQRMSKFFDHAYAEIEKTLTETKTMLDNKRGEQHIHYSHKQGDGAEHHQIVLKSKTGPLLIPLT